MSTIEQRLTELLVGKLKVSEDAIRPDVTFDELSFDSLVLTEFSLILEKQFQVELAEGELTKELTLNALSDLIAAKGTKI